MPARKTSSTVSKTTKHVNGEFPVREKKTMKATGKTTAQAEPKVSMPLRGNKRKGEEPAANGTAVKRPKTRRDSAASVPTSKVAVSESRATRVEAKKTATTKTKSTRSKAVINHAPTERLNVYVFGEGASGELGLGSAKGQLEVKRPRLNPLLAADKVGVVQLAVGGMHTAVLTHDNKILTWGVNDQGALGRDTSWEGGLRDMDDDDNSDSDSDGDAAVNPHESTPEEVNTSKLPKGTVFTQVACTDSATFALTDEGLLYGWGTFRSNEGIFGFSSSALIEYRPVLVQGLKKITKVACGANHVLALANNGTVYAWGSGQQNQLGRRILERHQISSLTPTQFGLPKAMVNIGAGSYHSFAVHKNGDVYSWGLNSFGETGIPKDESEDAADVHHPAIIETLRGKGNVTCIEGGAHHTIAVTDKGECLVWGRLDAFQMGIEIDTLPAKHVIRDSHNHPRILTTPTQVPGIDAVQCAAGPDHCLVISRDGKAYAWGFSATFQTGLGTDEDVEAATQIDNTAVRGKKLVWAGAGGQFSVVAGIAQDDKPMVNGVNGINGINGHA